MKTAIYGAVFILAAGAASACPWAGKSYNASLGGVGVDFDFTFDDTCATVVAQRSGRQPETVETIFINLNRADHGWYFQYDLFEWLFRHNGERADVRQGGARRNLHLRERTN